MIPADDTFFQKFNDLNDAKVFAQHLLTSELRYISLNLGAKSQRAERAQPTTRLSYASERCQPIHSRPKVFAIGNS